MNTAENTEQIQHIHITDLQADPKQPRKFFDKKPLQELANDIAKRGIIEPIIYFIDKDGKNTILAGERRFRASQLAKLETVPCLLRDSGTDMERLLDQVSENFQREGLNPIEMATFFKTLTDDFEVRAKDIPTTLIEYGFKKFDRSYISNIIRLLNLPAWAKTLIQKDQITAAHGKYLLQALPSKQVMKQMQNLLKEKTPTTRRLQDAIENAYDELHVDVCRGKSTPHPDYGYNVWQNTKFDWKKECKDCSTCQALKTEHSTTIYCLNEQCYDEKQQAAIVKIEKAEERAKKSAETKRINKLKKQAEAENISLEELEARDEILNTPLDNSRAQARVERTQQYLDEWLRKQIDTNLLENQATRYQVILWMAAGAPGDDGVNTSAAGSVNLELDKEFTDHGIDLTLQQKVDITNLELMTCTAGINTMSRTSLRKLAHYVGIKLEGSYSIDRDYLDIKQKNEVIETTPEAVIQSYDDGEWQKTCKKSADFIKYRILTRDYLYGIPADLQEMYNEHEEAQS